MKTLMQKIFELLADFILNGYYDISNNTIVFEYCDKVYRLSVEEVK
jgi:hypothetical protein